MLHVRCRNQVLDVDWIFKVSIQIHFISKYWSIFWIQIYFCYKTSYDLFLKSRSKYLDQV